MEKPLSLVFWQARRRLVGRRQWWWTLTHPNGNVVGGSTEGYDNYSDAVANASLVLSVNIDAEDLIEFTDPAYYPRVDGATLAVSRETLDD